MKRKISKIIAMLLVLITLLSQSIPVYALTEGKSYSYTENYLSAYYDTGTWQTADGHTHDNYGQVCLRNLKTNGEPLYCIQIYEGCDGSAVTAVNIKDTNLWRKELTSKAITGITRVSIYGYPNYSYGYSSTNAQLATQVLLWEFEIGKRTGYSTTVTSFAKSICSNYPDALKCYAEILKACSNHRSVPSFSTSNVELKGAGSSNAVTLTDTNGVLSNFTVASSNTKIKASISGNKLTVYATETGKISGTLTLTKNNTSTNSAFALTGANQTLFYGTIADPISALLTVELSTGTLKLVKTSEDGAVSGFTFNISGNGVNKNATTNSKGELDVADLVEGTYKITEVLSSEQKRYVQPASQTVKITAGNTTSVSFKNILKKATAKFQKTDIETGKEIESKDGIFGTYEYDNTSKTFSRIGEMQYDENLEAYVTDTLVYTASNDGKFKIVEEKAPTGYLNPTDLSYEFTITEDGEVIDINNGKIDNEPQKGKIEIFKYGEVLTGFTSEDTEYGTKYIPSYEIESLSDSVWEITALEDIVFNGEVKHYQGELIQTLTTTEEGALSEDLYPGKYLVKEVSAPVSYYIGNNEFEVELENDSQTVPFVQSYEGYNDRQKYEVHIQKSLEENPYYYNEDAYKSVIFGIYSNEDVLNSNGDIILEKGSLVDFFGIDENGNGVSTADLPSNFSWYAKEIKTSEEYILSEEIFEFLTEPAEQDISLIQIDINDGKAINNKLKRGRIEGVKRDNRGAALEGALIGLFSIDETEFTKENALEMVTSSKNGKFAFEDITKGKYIVKEIESPEGYKLDDNKYAVEIVDDGDVVNIEITDEIIIGKMVLYTDYSSSPKTGADTFMLPIIFLLTGGCILIKLHLDKRRKNI